MSAPKPGDRMLIEVEVESVSPSGILAWIVTSAGETAVRVDALLPLPGADVLEAAHRVLTEHMWEAGDDRLCSCDWTPDGYWQVVDGRRYMVDALANAEEGDDPDPWEPFVAAFVDHQGQALARAGLLAADAEVIRQAKAEAVAQFVEELEGVIDAERITVRERSQYDEDPGFDVVQESALDALIGKWADRADRIGGE